MPAARGGRVSLRRVCGAGAEALADRGVLLERDAVDRREVAAVGCGAGCGSGVRAGHRLLLRLHRCGLLRCAHLLGLRAQLLRLIDHVGRLLDHVFHVFHLLEHAHFWILWVRGLGVCNVQELGTTEWTGFLELEIALKHVDLVVLGLDLREAVQRVRVEEIAQLSGFLAEVQVVLRRPCAARGARGPLQPER